MHDLKAGNTVRELSHAIHAQDQDQSLVLGVQPTLARAQGIVQRLSFETDHFNRRREISAEHLPENVLNQLFLIRTDLPALQAGVFRELQSKRNWLCRLRNTPWTDQHLELLNTRPAELRQQQLDYGLPAEFEEIPRLAEQADVRLLLLDPDAAFLDGLPVFKDLV